METYKTVGKAAEAEITEQRSRFISAVKPVRTESEAIEFINERRQKFRDARHNVYAYTIKNEGISRFSDDGEPHSTAGKPTLEVILGRGITDAVIVTTRYFGGILLGTGGLVRCYSGSAAEAVKAAGIIEMRPGICCSTICPYPFYERLRAMLESSGAVVSDPIFESEIKLEFCTEKDNIELVLRKIREAFSGKLQISIISEKYMPFILKSQ